MKSLHSSTLVALLAIAICGGTQLLSAVAYRNTYPTLGDRAVPATSDSPGSPTVPHRTSTSDSDAELASVERSEPLSDCLSASTCNPSQLSSQSQAL